MLTLWRNASIATCDDQGRVFERGALVTEDATHRVGRRRARPARGPAARSHDRTRASLGHARPGRLPHARRVRRATRRRIRAPHGRHELRRDRPRGRRHPEHGARDARCSVDDLVRAEPAARACAAAGRRDDARDQVGLRAGYETERRMLLAARALEAQLPVRVVTSLLAAHAVPPEFADRSDEYLELVLADWLPRFAAESRVSSTRSTRTARASPSAPPSAIACSRPPPRTAGRCGCIRTRSRTSAAAAWRRAIVRSPAITSNTPRRTTSSNSPARAPSRCCCRSRITCSATRNCRRSSTSVRTASRSRSRATRTPARRRERRCSWR